MEVVNNEVTTVRGTCLRSRWPAVPMCPMSPSALLDVLGSCVPQKPHQDSPCLLLGRQCFSVSQSSFSKREGFQLEASLTAHGAAWALSKMCESGVLNSKSGRPQMLEAF